MSQFTEAQIEKFKQSVGFDQIIAERIARRLAAYSSRVYDPLAVSEAARKVKAHVAAEVNPDFIMTIIGGHVPQNVQRLSVRTEDLRPDQEMIGVIDEVLRLLLSESGESNNRKKRRQLRVAATITLEKKMNIITKYLINRK